MKVSRTVRKALLGALSLTMIGAFNMGLSPTAAHAAPVTKNVAIYKGGAACVGCPESAAAALRSDTSITWNIRYVGDNQSYKLNSASLQGMDLYVQPGGGTINRDWPKLTTTGQQAVKQYVEGGGNYLGLCLGGFFAGKFGSIGWDWIPGVGTYTGPKYANGEIVKTTWNGQPRYMWWEGGSHFGTTKPGTQVLGVHENGKAAAVVVPAGLGRAGGIGPHGEADRSWYSRRAWRFDTDGVDYDLVRKVAHATIGFTPTN